MDGLIPLSTIWFSLLAVPIAFGTVAALTPVVIVAARRWGWVEQPSAERWHRQTTALMGGIALYAGVAAALLLLAGLRIPLAFAASASLMFISGLVDDRLKISPAFKVVLQLAAAILFVSTGHLFVLSASPWLTTPLTVFWLLGITNGINLIDNMDGLASGVSAIAALALGAMALIAGAPVPAVAAFAIAGASGGFLIYNFRPARIFMGDCGSLFLGFSLAALSVMVQGTLEIRGLMAVFMTAMILGVPILDTILVTIVRSLNGVPVARGGRDHTSHRLVSAGLSERRAVVLLYAVAAAFGLLAIVFYLSDVRLRFSLLIFSVLGAGIFGMLLGAEKVYRKVPGAGEAERLPLLTRLFQVPRALFGPRWKPLFAVLVDAVTLAAAFTLAHFLRFEDGLTSARQAFLVRSLPLAVLLPLPVFALFGLYRAVWRQAGALEILRVVVAVTVGILALYGGLIVLHGFSAVSRGVLVIEWMAMVLSLIMTRFGFRGLRSYLVALNRRGMPVAVYGAGEDGVFTLTYIRRNMEELGMFPVAVIDNEEAERGHLLQGLPVLGGLDRLPDLKENFGVGELILPYNHLDREARRRIEAACRSAGLSCRTLRISLEGVKKGGV